MARFSRAIWQQPEWNALSPGAQLFAMTCIALHETGNLSNTRISRKTGWDEPFIAGARAEVEASAFAYMLTERATRRKIPAAVVAQVMSRDGSACVYCYATAPLEIDHVHPVSRGGSDDISNLQVLCAPCNRRKGAKIIENPVHQA